MFLPHYLTLWECQCGALRPEHNRGDMAGWSRTRVQGCSGSDHTINLSLPQIPHSPEGWRDVTCTRPGNKSCVWSAVCNVQGLACFFIHKELEWKQDEWRAVTQATGVLWHGRGMLGGESAHSCPWASEHTISFHRDGDKYFYSVHMSRAFCWINCKIFCTQQVPHDIWTQVGDEGEDGLWIHFFSFVYIIKNQVASWY